MGAPKWDVPSALSNAEEAIAGELKRTGKLFGFLRRHRQAILGDEFEAELCGMYRESEAGKPPLPPALMAFVLLMQAYTGVSDAEAVERARFDARWQLVLGVVGASTRPFSQGALCAFRERLIAHDMDRRLLERTLEFARSSRDFDSKKLPKTLRLAVDSRPLEGAGRVEDAVNLLGRAGRQLLVCAAVLAEVEPDALARRLKIGLLLQSSIKAALDVDWTDDEQSDEALRRLLAALDTLEKWVRKRFASASEDPPLHGHLELVAKLRNQNIDPEPPEGGGPKVRDGVAPDRIISVKDQAERHGRKSTSKTINGYKNHVATDLDDNLVLACAVLPANRSECEGFDAMHADLERTIDLASVDELHIDRGYTAAKLTHELVAGGATIISKPRGAGGRPGFFNKRDFKIDLRSKTVTCPAGQKLPFAYRQKVIFNTQACQGCQLRQLCTAAKNGRPRSIRIGEDEPQQRKLLRLVSTKSGRARLRERVGVEHTLARHARVQGVKARYVGTRSNVFDSRRGGAIVNLEAASRLLAA